MPQEPHPDQGQALRAPRPALRVGIIGCAIGRARYHAALTAASARFQIAGLADTDDRYARVWARELGGKVPAFEDAGALLARADSLDCLLIASPLATRAADLRAALAVGKPLLCECPLASTLAETDALIALAQAAGVLLMPALPRRFDAWFQAAARALQEETLGALQQIRCHWSFPIENVDETGDVVTGGWNALAQTLGSQTADVCRWWLGEARTVSGDVDLEEMRGARRANGRLREERALANLIVAHERAQSTHHLARARGTQPDERYLFSGANGSMELIVSAGAAGTALAAPRLTRQSTGQKAIPVSVRSEQTDKPRAALAPASARIYEMLTHFADVVQQVSSPLIVPHDARAALEIVHAAYLSTQEQSKISLPLRRDLDIARMLLPPTRPLPSLPPSTT